MHATGAISSTCPVPVSGCLNPEVLTSRSGPNGKEEGRNAGARVGHHRPLPRPDVIHARVRTGKNWCYRCVGDTEGFRTASTRAGPTASPGLKLRNTHATG